MASGVCAYEEHLNDLQMSDGGGFGGGGGGGAGGPQDPNPEFFLDEEEPARLRNASVDESVTESVGVFEGPEKTLEVCFLPGVGAATGCRALARPQLDAILAEARCAILSRTSNAHLDAYVLSESSLFVYLCRCRR